MNDLQERIANCQACHLRGGCAQVVLGAGPEKARVVVVGPYTSGESDLLNEPFAGREGDLIRRFLAEAGLTDDAYLTNLTKCAGKISEESIRACKGWLWEEIQRVGPHVVVPLGEGPTSLLLKGVTFKKLGQVAGMFHRVGYMRAWVAPWYPPFYLLRKGKKSDQESVAFFRRVRECCDRERVHKTGGALQSGPGAEPGSRARGPA